MRHWILLASLVTVSASVAAQQVPDTAFHPPIPKPAFLPQRGEVEAVRDWVSAGWHTDRPSDHEGDR
jgi:hypothetical protein